MPLSFAVLGKPVRERYRNGGFALARGGRRKRGNKHQLSAPLAAKNLIRQIEELNARLDIPETLKGIKAEDIPELAKRADKEANPIYPVPVLWNARELEQFYYAVMEKNEADKKSDKNN